jgi:hypothetical protein
MYRCETWVSDIKGRNRPRVFENRVLRRIFGPKTDEVTEDGENCITKSFVIYALPQV